MPIRKSGRALTDRPAVRLALVTLASVIMAVNIKSFVEAGGLFPGGFNGLTLLIQRSLQQFAGVTLPFSLINFLLNAIPAIVSFRLIGKRFTLYSCLMIVLTSVLTDVIPSMPLTDDVLLICIFGGIINGLGMSLILNNNASSGGTDFIAMTLSAKYKISTFNYMLLFSAAVILTSGFLFGMDKALYSIIFQFCNTQVINTFYKKYHKKTLLIITEDPASISADILELTHHSSTIFKGMGFYSAHKKYLIYTVLSDSDVRKVRKQILAHYPGTFVSVLNSSDVIGNFYIQPLE